MRLIETLSEKVILSAHTPTEYVLICNTRRLTIRWGTPCIRLPSNTKRVKAHLWINAEEYWQDLCSDEMLFGDPATGSGLALTFAYMQRQIDGKVYPIALSHWCCMERFIKLLPKFARLLSQCLCPAFCSAFRDMKTLVSKVISGFRLLKAYGNNLMSDGSLGRCRPWIFKTSTMLQVCMGWGWRTFHKFGPV